MPGSKLLCEGEREGEAKASSVCSCGNLLYPFKSPHEGLRLSGAMSHETQDAVTQRKPLRFMHALEGLDPDQISKIYWGGQASFF